MKSIVSRLIATIFAIVAYGLINFALNPVATILSGQIAGKQFENNNASYVVSQYGMNFFGNLGIPVLILLIVLAMIWWKHLKMGWAAIVAGMVLCMLLGAPRQSNAYYDKTDWAEAYTILPNESAFWIPDVGANKESQAQMDSEAYLNANKVSLKRYIVPHTKLSGSGSFFDYYVPSGRLLIVDRTPFSREWVSSHDRGTSNKNEAFPCQSKEGLNVSVGVTAGASVLESNAAKYLYRFGVLAPVGERNDPKVIFTSVYYSRKLADVMDDVGRKKIQSLVCGEIASRMFDKVNEESNDILNAIKAAAVTYFASVGITLDFLGWADTFTFDHDVQKAVNDAYMAQKLAEVLPILQALAQLKVQEGLGKGLETRGLPIVVTPDMINALIGMVKPMLPLTPAQ